MKAGKCSKKCQSTYVHTHIYNSMKEKIINIYKRIQLTIVNATKNFFFLFKYYISLLDLGSHQRLADTEGWLFCYYTLLLVKITLNLPWLQTFISKWAQNCPAIYSIYLVNIHASVLQDNPEEGKKPKRVSSHLAGSECYHIDCRHSV